MTLPWKNCLKLSDSWNNWRPRNRFDSSSTSLLKEKLLRKPLEQENDHVILRVKSTVSVSLQLSSMSLIRYLVLTRLNDHRTWSYFYLHIYPKDSCIRHNTCVGHLTWRQVFVKEIKLCFWTVTTLDIWYTNTYTQFETCTRTFEVPSE